MPLESRAPADVLKLDRVVEVGHTFIRTADHRIYDATDGVDLGEPGHYRIEPATNAHRAAIRATTTFGGQAILGHVVLNPFTAIASKRHNSP